MTDEERCHAEQARAAAYLADCPQGPEARGARLGVADWMAEEVLIMGNKIERHKELAARYMQEANGATWLDWIEDLLLKSEARISELTADEVPRQTAERIASILHAEGKVREYLLDAITTAIQAASNAQLERGRAKIAELEGKLEYQLGEIDGLAHTAQVSVEDAYANRHVQHVRDFMAKFGQYIGDTPGFPPQEVLESKLLRVTEEFCELIAACGYKPHVQISDQDGEWVIEDEITAVCDTVQDLPHAVREAVDLEYSTHHLMISCGVDTAEPWARVCEANMRKELRAGQPVKSMSR